MTSTDTRAGHQVAGLEVEALDDPRLTELIEAAIEAEMEKPMVTIASERLGKAERVDDARGRYIEYCKSTIPFSISLRGLKIVVDCANGACSGEIDCSNSWMAMVLPRMLAIPRTTGCDCGTETRSGHWITSPATR